MIRYVGRDGGKTSPANRIETPYVFCPLLRRLNLSFRWSVAAKEVLGETDSKRYIYCVPHTTSRFLFKVYSGQSTFRNPNPNSCTLCTFSDCSLDPPLWNDPFALTKQATHFSGGSAFPIP